MYEDSEGLHLDNYIDTYFSGGVTHRNESHFMRELDAHLTLLSRKYAIMSSRGKSVDLPRCRRKLLCHTSGNELKMASVIRSSDMSAAVPFNLFARRQRVTMRLTCTSTSTCLFFLHSAECVMYPTNHLEDSSSRGFPASSDIQSRGPQSCIPNTTACEV
jgi:hypothetical protein